MVAGFLREAIASSQSRRHRLPALPTAPSVAPADAGNAGFVAGPESPWRPYGSQAENRSAESTAISAVGEAELTENLQDSRTLKTGHKPNVSQFFGEWRVNRCLDSFLQVINESLSISQCRLSQTSVQKSNL